jgi:ribosome biogenesis GTPase A
MSLSVTMHLSRLLRVYIVTCATLRQLCLLFVSLRPLAVNKSSEMDEFVELVGNVNESLRTSLKRLFLDTLSASLVKVGIVGAPNVGKSTLCNALVRNQKRESLVENALFSTIDVFCATYDCPDPRLNFFQSVSGRDHDDNGEGFAQVVPTQITVVDTPAIVAGSFKEVGGRDAAAYYCWID